MNRCRTVWISDLHLGARACRAQEILDFLGKTDCDRLYLVGDIIDLQSLRKSFYWPSLHTEVLTTILRLANTDTEVIYIPGNHDHDFRRLAGMALSGVKILRRAIHETQDGKKLLVTHGDEFDTAVRCPVLLRGVGSVSYRLLLVLNRLINSGRALLGKPYWSLAGALKQRIANAMTYVATYEEAALKAAKEAQVDGVVCGHIHRPALFERAGIRYCNDGDWVESCTALIEDHGGALRIASWQEEPDPSPSQAITPLRDAA